MRFRIIVLSVIMCIVLAACGNSTASSTTTTPNDTLVPAASPTPTILAITSNALPAGPTCSTGSAACSSPTAIQATPTVVTSSNSGELEITFKSGDTTYYGTLLIPQTNKNPKMPAALLLSGSGPTDRDGNSRLLAGKIDSHLNLARILADEGIITLRYDKFGSGKTGIGSANPNKLNLTFDLYLEASRAAYEYLASRPEVDPSRMMILGHSEGGLNALLLGNQLKANPPKALILAMPLSRPYLETLRMQLTAQYNLAVKNGQATQEQVNLALIDLERAITSINANGVAPIDLKSPPIKSLFSAVNGPFLAQVGRYDPPKLATQLPTSLNVLVLCGLKDVQVSCDDAKNLMTGFAQGKATLQELTNVNHVFKEVLGVPNPDTDYTNAALKFSQEATDKIKAFVKAHL